MLEFDDGERAAFDVLVGADGVGSAVRRRLAAELADVQEDEDGRARAREGANARFSGTFVYRAMIPTDAVLEVMPEHPAAHDPIVVST